MSLRCLAKLKSESVRRFYELDVGAEEIAILIMEYSGVMLRTRDRSVIFDPADLIGPKEADAIESLDLLVYTHNHYDHYDRRSALILFNRAKPVIVAESGVFSDLSGRVDPDKLFEAVPGEIIDTRVAKITAISGSHVGPENLYVVELPSLTVFHGGDSAYVPLSGFRVDLALVPTGSPSPTASPNDAIRMVTDLKPRIAIPFHGTASQHKSFIQTLKRRAPDVRTKVLEKWEPVRIELI